MRLFQRFRRFWIAAGLSALFLTGYVTVSTIQAPSARAQICFNWNCIEMTGDNIASNLATEFAQEVVVNLFLVLEDLEVYYRLHLFAFEGKIMYKIAGIIKDWDDYWDTFWNYNLAPALKDMTEQLIQIDNAQAQHVTMFQDAANRNRELLRRQVKQIEAHRAHRPSENACVAGTVTGGMGRSSVFARAYGSAAPAAMGARSMNSTTLPDGTPTATFSTPMSDTKDRFNRYLARYAEKDISGGSLQQSHGLTADAPFAGADVDVTGQIFARDTIPADNDTQQTINDLIVNIAEPRILPPLPQEALYSEDNISRRSYTAKRQAVYGALYFPVAQRLPGSGLGDFVNAIKTDIGYDASQFSSDPSRNEVLNIMMSERFRSGKYGLKTNSSPELAARESLIQQAFQVMQMNTLLDLMDQYSLVLAAQTSPGIKKANPLSSRAKEKPM